MRLTEHLGYPHPDYLTRLLTAEQLCDWIEYEKHVGRFGRDRDDVLHAKTAMLLANAWGGKTSLQDHMPYYDAFADDLSEQELLERIGYKGGKDNADDCRS